jgi:hypothetical protein
VMIEAKVSMICVHPWSIKDCLQHQMGQGGSLP